MWLVLLFVSFGSALGMEEDESKTSLVKNILGQLQLYVESDPWQKQNESVENVTVRFAGWNLLIKTWAQMAQGSLQGCNEKDKKEVLKRFLFSRPGFGIRSIKELFGENERKGIIRLKDHEKYEAILPKDPYTSLVLRALHECCSFEPLQEIGRKMHEGKCLPNDYETFNTLLEQKKTYLVDIQKSGMLDFCPKIWRVLFTGIIAREKQGVVLMTENNKCLLIPPAGNFRGKKLKVVELAPPYWHEL